MGVDQLVYLHRPKHFRYDLRMRVGPDPTSPEGRLDALEAAVMALVVENRRLAARIEVLEGSGG